ncbi:hypothetical protein DFH09DRAFT_932424, partial [Mycena vulgaris]
MRISRFNARPPLADLGVKFAAEVPVGNGKAYKQWLEKLREDLDDHFEHNKHDLEPDDKIDMITRTQPCNDGVMIEWTYEIDLDHGVFLGNNFSPSTVDGNPLFALNNMPGSQELFLECIGIDSYGHRAYSPSTPSKHRYNWKSTPPKVDDRVVNDYDARQLTSDRSKLAIAELLDTTASVHNCEAARIGLYEVIVSEMMTSSRIGHDIRHLEAVADRAEISSELASVGVSMVDVAIGRMVFSEAARSFPSAWLDINALRKRPRTFSPTQLEFSWLAPDICMRITTHLDDERNMKKSVLDLVDEVILRRKPGIITYGIIFSFFHCIVVRVD